MLELLENLDYADRLTPCPSPSSLASELAERLFTILSAFSFDSAEQIQDQLYFLAKATNYPLKGKVREPRQTYSILIEENDIDITDFLLSITLEKKKNSTGCACVVVCLWWLLNKDENKPPITVLLKGLGLNTTYGNIQTKNILKELSLA